MLETIKKYWNKKMIDTSYELKYEQALHEIEDLKNQIKVLKRKLSTDYKTNLNEDLKKQITRKNNIIENLKNENLKLIKKA
jgi:cell division septum initiation protein DivIVA